MTDEKITSNEILSDEQLDNVAGGSERQMETDVANFKKLGVLPASTYKHDGGAIQRAFALFGIEAKLHGGHFGKSNEYFYNGVKLNQEQAWSVVINKHAGGYHPTTN